MARIRKGKEVAGKAPAGKRTRDGDGDKDNDKSGGGRKRNRSVLQFFENVAAEAGGSDASDDSDFDDCVHFPLSPLNLFILCYGGALRLF